MTMRTAVWLWTLLGVLAPDAQATPTKSVRVTTYQELAEGQVSGVLLSSQGKARAGFVATRLALPALSDDSIRAISTASDGTVYLGTGGEAPSVLVYEKNATAGKAALRRLAKLESSTFITALCPLEGAGQPPGQVLATTAQDGRIFRVQADGKLSVAAQVEGERIWALFRDGKRGITYAATGPGALWAIADSDLGPANAGAQTATDKKPPTRARKIFESEARQFLSIERGEDGALYLGTADDAVLYRVDPNQAQGGARAVHDFAGNEVRAIAHYKDMLFVAVNDMQRGDTGSRGTKIVPPAAGTAPGVKAAPPTGSTAPTNPSPVEKKGKGAIYRIDASGRVEQLHAIVDGFFNALTVDQDGNLYAAASTPGGRGRLYLLTLQEALPTIYTALEVKESDILALGFGNGKIPILGTGNSGAVYTLPPFLTAQNQPPADAHYLSKVFYAQAPSQWGNLRFSGSGVLVQTRSGNLGKPDASWSAWQPLLGVTEQPATDEKSGKIASPSGRYLQVRMNFLGQAILRDFTFYYQPVNQRPRLTEVLIGEDPSGRVARAAKPASPLRSRSPLVRLRWKVENPDDDELNYRLYVRQIKAPGPSSAPLLASPGDATWLRLGPGDGAAPLVRSDFDWNTETVADGLYELKVVVSDERSNPPDRALVHELISPPFLVDNKRPEVRDLVFDAAIGILRGQAVDATSPIAELGYAIDGGEFYPLGAKDGVLDDLREDFAFAPPRLLKGLHTVLLRAIDAADNLATAQIVIDVK